MKYKPNYFSACIFYLTEDEYLPTCTKIRKHKKLLISPWNRLLQSFVRKLYLHKGKNYRLQPTMRYANACKGSNGVQHQQLSALDTELSWILQSLGDFRRLCLIYWRLILDRCVFMHLAVHLSQCSVGNCTLVFSKSSSRRDSQGSANFMMF